MTKEIWKAIEGYEGYYEISNLGRVKSIDRYVRKGGHSFHVKEKILKQHINDSGYPIVILTKEKKSKWVRVHRLIAEAFIPNPNNLPEIDHINTDKKDYRIDNLRWVSHKQNMNNAITKREQKIRSNSPSLIKKRHATAKQKGGKTAPKTVYKYSLSGEYICCYNSIRDAAKEHNVTSGAIDAAIKKRNYNCAGFQWRTTYAYKIKSYKKKYCIKGIERLDENGSVMSRWDSIKDACLEMGINSSTIHRNIYPKGWKGMYRFRYSE